VNNTKNSQKFNSRRSVSARNFILGRSFLDLSIAGLLLLALGSQAHADTLTLYAYPSPTGINWSSPNTLAWSTIASMLVSDRELHSIHAIGHMNLDLKCENSSHLPHGARIMTGQTSMSSEQEKSEIFKEGYGLEVFLTPVPGRWETQAEIEADLPIREQRGSMAFIEFTIAPKTCARVVKYLNEYKARGFDKIYGGLEDRPRYREGAGCSAFAEGVLEVAGLMDPIWTNYFRHHVNVPNALLGGPSGRNIPFTDLLFGLDSFEWNESIRNSYALDFWDPYYAYYWIQQAAVKPLLLQKFKYQPTKKVNAPGIAIDARNALTPTDPFFLN